MKGPSDLDDHERRCIMLLLPVPDLLRLSATSRGHRADLFRLMHGDLSVRLSISVSTEGVLATDSAVSFRAFLEAGGAPLIRSLAMAEYSARPLTHTPALAWLPMPALESLSVSFRYLSSLGPLGRGFIHFLMGAVEPIIATARQLRYLRISFPDMCVAVSPMLERISGAATSAGGNLTHVSIEVTPENLGVCLCFCAGQAESCGLRSVDGIGLLPCPPFQRLQVEASCVYLLQAESSPALDQAYPNSGAAVSEQRAGRPPFWQKITLRPTDGICLLGSGAVPLRWLLDYHPAERLVIEGPPAMRLGPWRGMMVPEEEEAAFRETEAMFRKRITS